MNNLSDGISGAIACLLAGTFFESLPAAVSIICTCAVTAVTCFVQLYRMWRDRDNDKLAKKSSEEEKENNKNV